jgi:hypothetical protein
MSPTKTLMDLCYGQGLIVPGGVGIHTGYAYLRRPVVVQNTALSNIVGKYIPYLQFQLTHSKTLV